MDTSDQIMHNVPLPGDPIRGFDPMAADRMPMSVLWQTNRGLARLVEHRRVEPNVVLSSEFVPTPGATARFVNSTLGAVRVEQTIYRTGHTVPRLCPHGAGCNHPHLARLGFPSMMQLNCATGNAVRPFIAEGVETIPEARYMFVPAFPKDASARDDVVMIEEIGRDDFEEVVMGDLGLVIMRKLPNAHAVVVSERWLRKTGLHTLHAGYHGRVTFGINAADATLGLASFTVPAGEHGAEERFFIVFCTERENLGRRTSELARPLATAFDIIVESRGVNPELLKGVAVNVSLGASAKLEHFRHDITLPAPEYNGGPNKMALTLAASMGITYDEYKMRYEITQGVMAGDDEGVDRSQIITPSDVMNEQYPGALEGGYVYGANEVTGELERRSSAGCPGYGELCHLDYRAITRDTVEFQLERFGVVVQFDESRSVDPSDPENAFASHRNDRLAGIEGSHTARTFCGVSIVLDS